jgi:hypothetical protein
MFIYGVKGIISKFPCDRNFRMMSIQYGAVLQCMVCMVLANPVFAVAHRGHSSRHEVQEAGNTVRHKDEPGYVI